MKKKYIQMKKMIIALVALIGLTSYMKVQAQGVVFEKVTFADAMEKAKKQNKLVFIDFYTSWCSPCKTMDAEVFPKEAIGKVFNERFINLKIDAERGEGPELKKKYGVGGYPTMLLLNANDVVMHRFTGLRREAELLHELTELDRAPKYGGVALMKVDFNKGRKDLDFLAELFDFLAEKEGMKAQVAERYLMNVPEDVFLSEEKDKMDVNSKMIKSLSQFNAELMNRILQLLEKKKRKETTISSSYSTKIVFPVETNLNDFIQSAIKRAEEKDLEECIKLQQVFRTKVINRINNINDDLNMSRAYQLKGVSAEFVRLAYLNTNRNNPLKFSSEFDSYFNHMMRAYPIDSLKKEVDLKKKKIVNMAPREQKLLFFMKKDEFIEARSLSMKYMFDFIRYFWTISPNNSKTKTLVANWLMYTGEMNPINVEVVKDIAVLLVRVGHDKEAISMLQHSIDYYGLIKEGDHQPLKDMSVMITEIKNKKI